MVLPWERTTGPRDITQLSFMVPRVGFALRRYHTLGTPLGSGAKLNEGQWLSACCLLLWQRGRLPRLCAKFGFFGFGRNKKTSKFTFF